MKLSCLALLLGSLGLTCGCHTPRVAQPQSEPQLSILTYNVNWGSPRPDLVVAAILRANADIVCLQETTPQWESFLRQNLTRSYPCMQFRNSENRRGGGLGFLARHPLTEIAYVPSDTGWFDGWIMQADYTIGPIQLLNVHLRPPISDRGGWVSGYFTTGANRRQEIEKFFAARAPQLPTLVLGDFNDGEASPAVQWLESQGMINALPQFDRATPTWKWPTSVYTLKRRMDHILYSPELDCTAATVIPAGGSDHFPVKGVFIRATVAPERTTTLH
ncbi:MAG TPA: endonuclease/exonuclease/phosphatase family protein [Dongiaceae bacterium]|nr:endonuclease/exonuclease/phosphatase family protein [Dongiaceae bacterium]